ncbi:MULTISPECIES: hypothetical protein [Microcystis]|uniref:Uncharacterized protein n=1 Tax=Microcystis aeruginosa BLCC-F108 TaxID=2755317 RepID=A0A841UQI1_MICAE|nr:MULTISPECIES: hypothetical protein [Microcystis]MBC1192468.1 hypothetical protein [Microcystis aeruginosa BLCC-F108]
MGKWVSGEVGKWGDGEVGKWGSGGFSGNLPITLNPYCLLDSASDVHQ